MDPPFITDIFFYILGRDDWRRVPDSSWYPCVHLRPRRQGDVYGLQYAERSRHRDTPMDGEPIQVCVPLYQSVCRA